MVKINSRQAKVCFHKFSRNENLKQQWFIKIKRTNIQVDSTEFTESAESAENYNYVSSLIK